MYKTLALPVDLRNRTPHPENLVSKVLYFDTPESWYDFNEALRILGGRK